MSSYSAYIREAMAAKTPPAKGKRKMPAWLPRVSAIAAVLLLVAGLVAGTVIAVRSHRHHQLVAQLKQDPASLRQAVQSGQITREEARGIGRDMFAARMQKQLDGYFALPAGKARQQYLDKAIDEMEARRKQREARRPPQAGRPAPAPPAGRPPGPGAGPSGTNAAGPNGGAAGATGANARSARAESVPPERRAQFQQFRLDMRQRMQTRGITPPNRG